MNSISKRFEDYFSCFGSTHFATELAQQGPLLDLSHGQNLALHVISDREVLECASHHGDIGAPKKNLDARALSEQGKVDEKNEETRLKLLALGQEYKQRHGIKFMVCAKGKTGEEMLEILQGRLNNNTQKEWKAAREAMWQIFVKRMKEAPPSDSIIIGKELLEQVATKHNVQGVTATACWNVSSSNTIQLIPSSNSSSDNNDTDTSSASATSTQTKRLADPNLMWDIGSFGRIVSTCFAIEYFARNNISLSTTRVNTLLASGDIGSDFRLSFPSSSSQEDSLEARKSYADQVTLEDLLSNSTLDSLATTTTPEGPITETILQQQHVQLKLRPTSYSYHFSDAGLLLIQHIIECHANGGAQRNRNNMIPISQIALTFIQKSMGLSDMHYAKNSLSHGLSSTVIDCHRFLLDLARAYNNLNGSAGISHDTARLMLYGYNKNMNHIQTYIGVGTFVLNSVENNKYIVNYGSSGNARFFGMQCFEGIDNGKGFVVASSTDNNNSGNNNSTNNSADHCNCDVALGICRALCIQGFSPISSSSSEKNAQQQETIYSRSVVDCFVKERPDEIIEKGAFSDFLSRSFLNKSILESCTNDRFARAENLVSEYEPLFDPCLFGHQGKVMDSWESVRHNPRDCDEAVFYISPSKNKEKNNNEPIRYAYLSTKYHTGNQTPVVSVSILREGNNNNWEQLIPKLSMAGHSYRYIDLRSSSSNSSASLPTKFQKFRAEAHPDGGWTRLALYSESDLTAEERKKFTPIDKHISGEINSTTHEEAVPAAVKPLVEEYETTKQEVAARFAKLAPNEEYNATSLAYGAEFLSASDQHYSSARHALSPLPPTGMFDGFETARSRRPPETSYEEIQVALHHAAVIHRIEVDCTYFVNNAPREIEIFAVAPQFNHRNSSSSSGDDASTTAAASTTNPTLITLVPRTCIKHFSGGVKEFLVHNTCTSVVEKLIVRTIPCGGFNRLRAFARR